MYWGFYYLIIGLLLSLVFAEDRDDFLQLTFLWPIIVILAFACGIGYWLFIFGVTVKSRVDRRKRYLERRAKEKKK